MEDSPRRDFAIGDTIINVDHAGLSKYPKDDGRRIRDFQDVMVSVLRLCVAFCPGCGLPRRCRWIVRTCKKIPLCIEVATLCWAYYTYIYIMCYHLLADRFLSKWGSIIGYHGTLMICLWPFKQMLVTPLKPVPVSFYVMQRPGGAQGSRSYCHHCHLIKPERCHHCSICGICVLKMDHHCPWFNTCVSFTNYKFFVLFLFYSGVHCAYMTATTFHNFGVDVRREIGFWPDINITFLFLLSIFFGLAFWMLLFFHAYLICRNRTTLELMSSEANRYNLGICNNMAEVFGREKRLWLIPVYTTLGDGASFPVFRENIHKRGSLV
ncbi:palmitoyltransferase ZDHHC15-like [Ornithodoros turicata]|uniref:palmitoyltransferase ZDHHC15-like n=1 Tax=Ornithodoros turicata TaxID=34597 RepID=UPI0031388952